MILGRVTVVQLPGRMKLVHSFLKIFHCKLSIKTIAVYLTDCAFHVLMYQWLTQMVVRNFFPVSSQSLLKEVASTLLESVPYTGMNVYCVLCHRELLILVAMVD